MKETCLGGAQHRVEEEDSRVQQRREERRKGEED